MDAVKALKRAYQEIFLSKKRIDDTLSRLEKDGLTEEVRYMIEFIRNSKRGICKARGKIGTLEEYS